MSDICSEQFGLKKISSKVLKFHISKTPRTPDPGPREKEIKTVHRLYPISTT